MAQDRYDLPITTESTAACEQYLVARDALLAGTGDPIAAADAALELDPEFALAHAARARGLQLAAEFAQSAVAGKRAVAVAAHATQWEQQHVEITADLTTGRLGPAFEKLQSHIADYPRDALTLSSASGVFGLIGFSGRVGREPEQVAFLEPLAAHYESDWWFDSALAFALCENDRAEEAVALIESSLAGNPRSAHSAHIYTHVLIEAGKAQPGPQWLSDWLSGYSANGVLFCHLWWHLALFQLHAGDFESMRETLRTRCMPGQSSCPPVNVFTDSAAMLWRAEVAGVAHDESAWQTVRSFGDQWFARPGIFVDVHKALCLAALGEFGELDVYIASLKEADEKGKVRAGAVVVELATAFGEFARKEWRACADRLDEVADDVVRIGGSRAQRRIISETRDAARALVT